LASLDKISAALKKRAAQIDLLLMDVDGTMTDGGVILLSQPDGSALEIKKFDAHDGQGLTLARTAGLRTGCITGRESGALLRRAKEMKMEFIYMKQALKMPAYEEILAKAGVVDSAGHPVNAPRGFGSSGGRCGSGGQESSALHHESTCRSRCSARGSGAYPEIEGRLGSEYREGSRVMEPGSNQRQRAAPPAMPASAP
jgi:hypothetical protein